MLSENKFLFTSESVGRGHPDKICDQISDAILDECLRQDPFSRVAVDVAIKSSSIFIIGEITTKAVINYQKIVRNILKDIGYTNSDIGLDYKTCSILVSIQEQDESISKAVNSDLQDDPFDLGAGDQGMMFGYATDETNERIPATCLYAHSIVKRLEYLRLIGGFTWLRPDCKSQVTVEYLNNFGQLVPQRIHTVVVSTQHSELISVDELRTKLKIRLFNNIPIDSNTILHIQPSGAWHKGGPLCDSGLTGRKIMVDTYGSWGSHGGGAFSGKDWTKVDRSGAYLARWIAKSLVDNKICKRVSIQLAYCIGMKDPLAINIDTYNTSEKSDQEVLDIIRKSFRLRLGCFVKELGLHKSIYAKTSVYGHFGNEEYPWEKSKKLE